MYLRAVCTASHRAGEREEDKWIETEFFNNSDAVIKCFATAATATAAYRMKCTYGIVMNRHYVLIRNDIGRDMIWHF